MAEDNSPNFLVVNLLDHGSLLGLELVKLDFHVFFLILNARLFIIKRFMHSFARLADVTNFQKQKAIVLKKRPTISSLDFVL